MSAIEWYQHAVHGRPSPCRFTPSCSVYALESIEGHGARRGTWLTIRRLVRCRPFGPSGFDPVPEPDGSDRDRIRDPIRDPARDPDAARDRGLASDRHHPEESD